jgi:ADP-heptose:LPS heptosyltransferase
VRLDYGKRLWNEVFENNPRIARYNEGGDFQIYRPRPDGLRPYCKQKTERQWTWQEYKPPVGELYFDPHEKGFSEAFNPMVILEPHIKKSASPNKQWPWGSWQALVWKLNAFGLKCFQLGPKGTSRLAGVRFIETESFRKACAVLSRAKLAILTEGGLAHGAAAVGLRSVVVMGAYISPRVIGYDQNINLFVGDDLGCGMRVPCRHCISAMNKITPDMVFEEAKKLL